MPFDRDYDEFAGIVAQIRGHLELQRALGVTFVETIAEEQRAAANRAAAPQPAAETKQETRTAAPAEKPEKVPGLAGIRDELVDCRNCKLSGSRKNIVFGEGNPQAKLVFIGAGPGASEDEQGRPAVDAAGKLLTDIIVKGMNLKREEVYIANIVKCRIPDNRDPQPDEIEACEHYLARQIKEIKPKIIIALGGAVAKALLKTKEDIKAIRGQWRQYQGIALMPTLDPAHLLKNPADKKAVWEDIKKVMAELKK